MGGCCMAGESRSRPEFVITVFPTTDDALKDSQMELYKALGMNPLCCFEQLSLRRLN